MADDCIVLQYPEKCKGKLPLPAASPGGGPHAARLPGPASSDTIGRDSTLPAATLAGNAAAQGDPLMLFILYYIVAITVLILHFTGFLARNNLEWLVLVLAVTVFPAVIYL